jgi:hypothetical protein
MAAAFSSSSTVELVSAGAAGTVARTKSATLMSNSPAYPSRRGPSKRASETRNRLPPDSIQASVPIRPPPSGAAPHASTEPAPMSGRRFAGAGVAVESVTVLPDVHLVGHDHPGVHICCVTDGGFDELAGRGRRRCVRGSARLSPAGDRHDIRFGGTGVQCVLLFIDDDVSGLSGCRERVFYESAPVLLTATRLFGLLRRGEPADLFSI